ncbi:hypothetical protein BTJ40_15335 [Microbulbifer sp. A4B17]|uniref:hypothetical protein n=1 Tax=Microbulbifer sp. A4B17 TaxID=359370 RepID=UPI000D52E3AA|nr:hypothetical protein [Microbulbifer sp. A4B17]AWF82092.1 hypothetical protein BTJ40_15335 [Microbulbifer sp. A4B17]
MPLVKVSSEHLITVATEEIRRGNIFMLSEPHGNDICVDITKNVMARSAGGNNKLMLEAPIQMHSETRRDLEHFLSTTHTPRLKELPSYALKTGWALSCVDGDFRVGLNVDIRQARMVGRYSQARQAFIAGNISRVAKTTNKGCFVLYGRNHITGAKKSTRRTGLFPEDIISLAELLTGRGYKQRTRYQLIDGKTKVYAQAVGRAELL